MGSSASRIPGRGDEGAGEGDALLLPAAEFARAMAGAGFEADFAEPAASGVEGGGAAFAAGEQGHGDVFEGGEFGQEVVELPDVADLAVAVLGCGARGERSNVGSGDPDVAAGGVIERGEQVEQGAFAGAGLAYDGDHLAGGDGEVRSRKSTTSPRLRSSAAVAAMAG